MPTKPRQPNHANPNHAAPSPHAPRSMMADCLETYERELHSLEGSLRESEENLDNTRWVLACWLEGCGWEGYRVDASRQHMEIWWIGRECRTGVLARARLSAC